MAQQNESSSSDDDSDSESESDDDLILVDELKKPKPKKQFKRRNVNVVQMEETDEKLTCQLPQPKDQMVSSSLMNKFLEADKADEQAWLYFTTTTVKTNTRHWYH